MSKDVLDFLDGLTFEGVGVVKEKVFDLSIDKLAFTGDFSYYRGLNPIQKLINEDMEGIFTIYNGGKKGKIFDKVYFELLNRKTFGFGREFRLNFNPNKLEINEDEYIQERIIPLFTRLNCTEMHLAFDVELDLKDYLFLEVGNSARERWTKRDKKLRVETINLGSRESNNFVTIYNKKLERMPYYKKYMDALSDYYEKIENNEKYIREPLPSDFDLTEKEVHNMKTKTVWWRVEFKLRDDYVKQYLEPEKVFKDLKIFLPEYKKLDKKMKFEVFYYYHHPEELVGLDRKTRKKKLDKLVEVSNYDLVDEFKEVFAEEKYKIEKKYLGYYDKHEIKFYDYVNLLTEDDIINGFSDDKKKQAALRDLYEKRKNLNEKQESLFEILVYEVFREKRNDESGIPSFEKVI